MTTQKQLKDFSGAGKLAAEYFNSLKQMQDDFMKSRQDLLSVFSVSDSLNSGFASDSSAALNRSASIDTDTMNAAAQKILDARAARAAKAKQYSYSTDTPEEPSAYDLSYYQTLEQQSKDNLDSAQQALSLAQSVLEQTPSTGIMIGKYAKTYANEYTNANNDLSAAQENYNQAQNAYAQAKADRESFEAAILGTVNGLAVSTDRSLSDIEADLNAAGTYIEDLDQWVAKPGQQETLNNLLYEQRLAWKQQAEAVNKQYTKGDQITAATAASFGEGLDQFDTNTKISIYKLFGLDVPDYLLVKSPLAIQNEKTLENASGTLKTIGELSQIAGNAAPTMVLSMLFPASALGELGTAAKILGKVATSSSVYGSSYGGAYAQARNEGKTDTEASTYGVLSGASEVFLGEALGALAKGGSKFLSKKLENTVLGAIKNNASKAINEILGNSQTASAAAAIIKNMGKEAAEEYFQYALDPLMQNISFGGKDYTAKEMLTNAFSKEAFHSALLGALSSGTSQMTGLAVNGVASKLTGKGGLLSEANLNNLTESEAKEVNRALTNAYAGMLENEGYRNIEEYRKQAEKTNANKKSAITHALAIGTELSQEIKNRIGQVGEKAAQIGKQSGLAKSIAGSGEKASSLDIRQGLKTEGDAESDTDVSRLNLETDHDTIPNEEGNDSKQRENYLANIKSNLSLDQIRPQDRHELFAIYENATVEELAFFNQQTVHAKGNFYASGNGAYYDPNSKSITMNLLNVDDRSKAMGLTKAFGTYFHEMGHLIDDLAHKNTTGERLIDELPELRSKLESDALNYVNQLLADSETYYQKVDSLYDLSTDQRLKVSMDLSKDPDIKNAISDIFQGLTNHSIYGKYGHSRKPNYWENLQAIEKEAFAHMTEAMMIKGDKLKILKTYFPESYRYFYNLIAKLGEIQ